MRMNLYNFSKKHNSTKQLPTDAAPLATFDSLYLKQSTDIDSPTFLIDDQFRAANYVYLEDLGRYYFVSKNRLGNSNIYELECELDALATYKTQIQSYTAFVERCADSHYNPDILDNALSVEDMIEHTDSASTYCGIATGLLYIVRVLGRNDTGGIGTFVMNRFLLQNIFSQMWVDIDDGLGLGDLEEFMQMWIANPSQYIVGVYSSPIGASIYANNIANVDFYIGGHKTNLTLDKITNGDAILASGLVLNKPTSIYTDFRKTDPAFSEYYIYIPTIGTVSLASDLMDTVLTMDVSADLYSGDLLFVLKSDGAIVSSYNSNCYASQSIGGVNQAGSIFAGAAIGASAIVSGNPIGLIEGIKTAMQPTPSVIGSQGGTACVSQANEIKITVVQKSSAEFPLNVAGRPCCKNLALSSLSGFVKCANASLELPANEAVKIKVNDYLNSGFYIE